MAKRGRPPKHNASDEAINIFPDTEDEVIAASEYGGLETQELPNPVQAEEGSFEEVLENDFVNDTENSAPIHTKKTPSTLDGELPPTSRSEIKMPESPTQSDAEVGGDLRSLMNEGREHLLTDKLVDLMKEKEEEGKQKLAKTRGRFIEGQDNAKPGIPYSAKSPEYYEGNSNLTPQRYVNVENSGIKPAEKPVLDGQHESIKSTMRSEGVVLKEIATLDTGSGAQNSQMMENANKKARANNTFINPEQDPLEAKVEELQRRGDRNLKVSW